VKALTQEVTRAVERAVRAHPDHWFWVHRRWKTRPPEGLPPPVR
jgi:KDO2-lipid IV(A) lauroyltransferase